MASRLLGDVSVNFSMHNANHNSSNDGRQPRSQRANMRILRRERDIALEHGPKACKSLERMIERADGYFRVLVPRFGGFNAESLGETNQHETSKEKDDDINVTIDSIPASESNGIDLNDTANGGDRDEDDDDDSIDWEEGDIGLSENNNSVEDANTASINFHDDTINNNPSSIDHQTAVRETLDIMGRGGALLDGKLAVQINSGQSMGVEATSTHASAAETRAELATTTTEENTDLKSEAHLKLQNMVQKFSTRRLPRLNQWIHALSHADGMEERAVADPATSGTGVEGPVSLVLLSEGKRAMRGNLLKQIMKVKGEMDSVLESAAALGVRPKEAESIKEGSESTDRPLENDGEKTPVNGAHNNMAGMKRALMPGSETLAVKKLKSSRFKVIYRKT